VTEPQKQELERRITAHEANPDDVVSWEDVKAQALARVSQYDRFSARSTGFDEAFDWYEQPQADLGIDFLSKIAETLARMEALPESHEVVFGNVRRSVVQKFSYSIFYQIEPNQIIVLAVFHSKREPKTWQTRIW